jgi:hypothetical protein
MEAAFGEESSEQLVNFLKRLNIFNFAAPLRRIGFDFFVSVGLRE